MSKEKTYMLTGIRCDGRVGSVTNTIQQADGAALVSINLKSGRGRRRLLFWRQHCISAALSAARGGKASHHPYHAETSRLSRWKHIGLFP